MNPVTRDGSVYNDFDAVDIAIITDKSLDTAYDELEKRCLEDQLDGESVVESSLLQEDTFIDYLSEKCDTSEIDTEESNDITQLGMEADEYIDAMDSMDMNDIGDIIDIVAGI